jgi:hypothetical protein
VTKVGDEDFATTILDEQSFYLTAIEHELNIYDILPHDLVMERGISEAGNIIGYAHMWMKHKYLPENIRQIKHRILFSYPEYHDLVIKYENEVMFNSEIYYEWGLGLRL